jgi:hypothetical protein
VKNDVNVPLKSNKQKNKMGKFLLASGRSLMKRAGSGAGSGDESVSRRDGFEDPHPYQNVKTA